MQDKLIITEVITPDLYENYASQTAIFPKEKALEYGQKAVEIEPSNTRLLENLEWYKGTKK